ncbi:MAG: hypothetical protein R3C26_09035 [Calditrichia bacterium]
MIISITITAGSAGKSPTSSATRIDSISSDGKRTAGDRIANSRVARANGADYSAGFNDLRRNQQPDLQIIVDGLDGRMTAGATLVTRRAF